MPEQNNMTQTPEQAAAMADAMPKPMNTPSEPSDTEKFAMSEELRQRVLRLTKSLNRTAALRNDLTALDKIEGCRQLKHAIVRMDESMMWQQWRLQEVAAALQAMNAPVPTEIKKA